MGRVGVCVGRVGGLAGSKGQTWEGGIRMPGLARWPGRIAAGAVTDALVGTLDVFPTLLALAGGAPRADRVYDGADMAGVLFAPDPAAAGLTAVEKERADAAPART